MPLWTINNNATLQQEKFGVYGKFCSNHQQSSRMLSILQIKYVEFKNFLDVSRISSFSNDDFSNIPICFVLQSCIVKPELRKLLLSDFLIMPIQRICKYPLLLKVLLVDANRCDSDDMKYEYQSRFDGLTYSHILLGYLEQHTATSSRSCWIVRCSSEDERGLLRKSSYLVIRASNSVIVGCR